MNLAVLSLPEVHSHGRSTELCNAALTNMKVSRQSWVKREEFTLGNESIRKGQTAARGMAQWVKYFTTQARRPEFDTQDLHKKHRCDGACL